MQEVYLLMQQAEGDLPFLSRFFIYQRERFPFLSHGLFLSAFALCAISYSRICRGEVGFISLSSAFVASISVTLFFYILRVVDEFKDRRSDALHRDHLPVPRGLISLHELRNTAFVAMFVIIAINAILNPQILPLLLIPAGFIVLMSYDFFIPRFLHKYWPLYVLSHMFFYPAVDIYSSGFDWFASGLSRPPSGMVWFYLVSLLNGLVYEVGRKIKAPENEEHNSYTRMYGRTKAILIWAIIISVAFGLNLLAAHNIELGVIGYLCLSLLFISYIVYAWLFYRKPDVKNAKLVDLGSGAWGLLTYICLGALPHIS